MLEQILSICSLTFFFLYTFFLDITCSIVNNPAAHFAGLPTAPLYTLAVDTPIAWMVESVSCVYDLDNIRLTDVTTAVNAVFELEHLLVQGSCFEEEGAAPRGLQLVAQPLVSDGTAKSVDTVVMENLGYFQLKTSPGLWRVAIRPGRPAELYQFGFVAEDPTRALMHLISRGGQLEDVARSAKSISYPSGETDTEFLAALTDLRGKNLVIAVRGPSFLGLRLGAHLGVV